MPRLLVVRPKAACAKARDTAVTYTDTDRETAVAYSAKDRTRECHIESYRRQCLGNDTAVTYTAVACCTWRVLARRPTYQAFEHGAGPCRRRTLIYARSSRRQALVRQGWTVSDTRRQRWRMMSPRPGPLFAVRGSAQ